LIYERQHQRQAEREKENQGMAFQEWTTKKEKEK